MVGLFFHVQIIFPVPEEFSKPNETDILIGLIYW